MRSMHPTNFLMLKYSQWFHGDKRSSSSYIIENKTKIGIPNPFCSFRIMSFTIYSYLTCLVAFFPPQIIWFVSLFYSGEILWAGKELGSRKPFDHAFISV